MGGPGLELEMGVDPFLSVRSQPGQMITGFYLAVFSELVFRFIAICKVRNNHLTV